VGWRGGVRLLAKGAVAVQPSGELADDAWTIVGCQRLDVCGTSLVKVA